MDAKRIGLKKLGEQLAAMRHLDRALEGVRTAGVLDVGEMLGSDVKRYSVVELANTVDLHRHELLAAACHRMTDLFDAIDGEIVEIKVRNGKNATGDDAYVARDILSDRTKHTLRMTLTNAEWELDTVDYLFEYIDDLVSDGVFADAQPRPVAQPVEASASPTVTGEGA